MWGALGSPILVPYSLFIVKINLTVRQSILCHRWKLTDHISVSNFHPEPCSICSFYNAHIVSLKMYIETVDSLTFYSLLYVSLSRTEIGRGERGRNQGATVWWRKSRRRVHLSGVFETIKIFRVHQRLDMCFLSSYFPFLETRCLYPVIVHVWFSIRVV